MVAKLRAVKAGERARKPTSILEAVESGDRFAELEFTHRRIAAAVQDEETPARDLASLTRRQLEISRELDGLRRARAAEAEDAAKAGEVGNDSFDAEAI